MKIYLAGVEVSKYDANAQKAGAKNALFSYFNLPKNKLKRIQEMSARIDNLFMDSGGFSAFTQGVNINIDEYIADIKKASPYVKIYALLDVIGDSKATQKNLEYMESKGVKPLPVFHYGSDLNILKELVKKYDYIALGGLVPLARRKKVLMQWLDKCFYIIRDKCKIHGFGMTGLDILKRYPFYSVDSTAWLGGALRSEIQVFKGGEIKAYRTSDPEIQKMGIIRFTDNQDKRYHDRLVYNAKTWVQIEKFITNLWAKRGIIWED